MNIVITVHGVEARDKWQEHVHAELNGIDGLHHHAHAFGPIPDLPTPSPRDLDAAVLRLYQTYTDLRERHEGIAPSFIAQGFGTYLVLELLNRFQAEMNRVVLCGSILDTDCDWSAKPVQAVRNDVAGQDGLVRMFRNPMARSSMRGTGTSGLDGFTTESAKLEQHEFPHITASDEFVNRHHCRECWVPFILDTREFRDLCRRSRRNPDKAGVATELEQACGRRLAEGIALITRDGDEPLRTFVRHFILGHVIDLGTTGRYGPSEAVHRATIAAMELARGLF